MKHTAFTPTDEQRANLLRLAAHLDLVVTNLRFDMGTFQNECGTIGCACGHGPSLGIARNDRETWLDYAERAFSAGVFDPAHFWMFGGAWQGIDNTPRGAASRIRYALVHGIPENHSKQARGLAPLSYTIPERVEGPTVAAKVFA